MTPIFHELDPKGKVRVFRLMTGRGGVLVFVLDRARGTGVRGTKLFRRCATTFLPPLLPLKWLRETRTFRRFRREGHRLLRTMDRRPDERALSVT
jgi:hypothetical protein